MKCIFGKYNLLATLVIITLCSVMGAVAQKGFSFQEEEGKYLDVLLDGKRVLRYTTDYNPNYVKAAGLMATNKPVLHMFDPTGKSLISNTGEGGEHPHHRGIMIGWTRITYNEVKYNFWGMYNNAQKHRKFTVRKADGEQAVFTSLVDWETHTGVKLIEETRTYTVHRAQAPAYIVVDMVSVVTSCAGDLNLNGDPEHGGVQFRAADAMDRKSSIFAYPGENVVPRQAVDPQWVAGQFALDNQTYTVMQINNPANPKGARISAYRNYSRFGYFPEPLVIKNGEPYTLRYRFVAFPGALPTAEILQRECNAYTGTNDPVPPVTVKPAH